MDAIRQLLLILRGLLGVYLKKPVEGQIRASQRTVYGKWTLDSVLISQQAPKLAKSVFPTKRQRNNLKRALKHLIEPVDTFWGSVQILSGFRNPALNALVGGSKSSDHVIGAAIDFYIPGAPTEEVFYWIINQDLPYRQVIYYYDQNFIHISINTINRKEKHDAFIKMSGTLRKL